MPAFDERGRPQLLDDTDLQEAKRIAIYYRLREAADKALALTSGASGLLLGAVLGKDAGMIAGLVGIVGCAHGGVQDIRATDYETAIINYTSAR